MQQPAARLRAAIVSLVLTAQLASCLVPALAAAQGGSTSNVQKGQEYYEQSRFDEAISLLKDLVDKGVLAGEDLQHARELLARSYVKKGYPVQGKEMFKAILRTTPALLGLFSLITLWMHDLTKAKKLRPRASAWYSKSDNDIQRCDCGRSPRIWHH